MAVEFARLAPADLMAIQRQPSQRVQLGLVRDTVGEDEAVVLAAHPEAWTARDGAGRIVACFGLFENFPGRQATAWAVLAAHVGTAHLAITRFARARIAASRLRRIEAMARTGVPAECVWAKLVGLRPAHVLRAYGALSEDHMLYERILA